MLTYNEWYYKRQAVLYPSEVDRSTGRTFRCILQAAHAASLGDRVVVYTYNLAAAKHCAAMFLDMLHEWNFYPIAPGGHMVRQRDSYGLVVFRALPDTYSEYTRRAVGASEI